MAERSFVQEVQKLRLGAGEEFVGEGILAVTKALLESGVSYEILQAADTIAYGHHPVGTCSRQRMYEPQT